MPVERDGSNRNRAQREVPPLSWIEGRLNGTRAGQSGDVPVFSTRAGPASASLGAKEGECGSPWGSNDEFWSVSHPALQALYLGDRRRRPKTHDEDDLWALFGREVHAGCCLPKSLGQS
ncbi:hypothetical protein BDM02DRAFT_3113086 [Thelephora ganbajun]|uniref:Uncharacterized protein n=1 Tax=Thelephora ganbajun TaxID=370292 RepID=A0ACB6ZJX0_THEGA|nr:hypothetical protein BDM02DRAFT_3113086 [Thelephora ganbajun]